MRIFRKESVIEMTEKVEEKPKNEQQEKEAFFKVDAQKRRKEEHKALIKGWAILALVAICDYFAFNIGGWLLIVLLITPLVFFLIVYFVWGPKNVGWGSFVREGCYRAIMVGRKRRRYIGGGRGKEFNKDWDVIPIDKVVFKGWKEKFPSVIKFLRRNKEDSQNQPAAPSENGKVVIWRYDLIIGHLTWDPYKDLVIAGLHIIWEWPFATIYEEATEWERYYPNLKKALPRKELINEWTLLPYPHYIDDKGVEDENRLSVDILSNAIFEVENLDKALFGEAVSVIDIVRSLMKGGYVSFMKGTSLQKLLQAGQDIGVSLMEGMKSPTPEFSGPLIEMIRQKYGYKTISISIIDIIGSDKEMQAAINAKALAKLKRDAAVNEGDAGAQKRAIETAGQLIKSLAQMEVHIDPDKNETEQKKDLINTENKIRGMSPEDFERAYGKKIEYCIDFVRRDMAIKGGNFADIRTPDIKGGGNSSDVLASIVASRIIDGGNKGASQGESKKKDTKESDEDEKMWRDLERQGLPVEDIR